MLLARSIAPHWLATGRRLVSSCVHGASRTRFAPSPTGQLHLGGLRTALFAYLWARRTGGQFLLRIEDTDRTRLVPGAVEAILRDLRRCGIAPDEGPLHDAAVQESSGPGRERSIDLRVPNWAREALSSPQALALLSNATGEHGPYIQSERHATGLYRTAAEAMVQNGTAYRCFCSAERLQAVRESQQRRGVPVMYDRACSVLEPAESERRAAAGEPHTIRLRVPLSSAQAEELPSLWRDAAEAAGTGWGGKLPEEERAFLAASHNTAASGHGVASTVVTDNVLGMIAFSHSAVDDAVLLKSDGWPTYHLAAVVDDITMEITDVIRGQEWLTSFPKHVLVYRGLGVGALPTFTHLPLLLGPNRRKLSKRVGDASVGDVLDRGGILPEALVNFVAFLGWTPPGSAATADGDASGFQDADVMSLDDLASIFDISSVHKANAVVERQRLEWMHDRHVRRALRGLGPDTYRTDHGDDLRIRNAVVACLDWQLGLWGAIPDPVAQASDSSESETEVPLLEHMPAGWREHIQTVEASGRAVFPLNRLEGGSLLQSVSEDLLDSAIWLQHERAALPHRLAQLVAPLVAPPCYRQDAAFESAWHGGAASLLQLLLAEWRALPEQSYAPGSGIPRAQSLCEGRGLLPPAEGEASAVGAMRAVKACMAKASPDAALEGDSRKAKRAKLPASKMMLPLRWALTGQAVGASLSDVVALLGKDACCARIQEALSVVHGWSRI
jgi:glutamyl/glutaminyl-tRNA synthetase